MQSVLKVLHGGLARRSCVDVCTLVVALHVCWRWWQARWCRCCKRAGASAADVRVGAGAARVRALVQLACTLVFVLRVLVLRLRRESKNADASGQGTCGHCCRGREETVAGTAATAADARRRVGAAVAIAIAVALAGAQEC